VLGLTSKEETNLFDKNRITLTTWSVLTLLALFMFIYHFSVAYAACIPGVNCPWPDLILNNAKPFQAVFDQNELVENKYFKFKLEIISPFSDGSIVPIQFLEVVNIDGQTVETGGTTENIPLDHGLNLKFFPTRAGLVDNDMGPTCLKVIIDPLNTIRESTKENNEIMTCLPIEDTKQLRVGFIPVNLNESGVPTGESMNRISSLSTSFLEGTFPVSDWGERQLVSYTSPFPVAYANKDDAILGLASTSWFTGDTDVPHYDEFVGVVTNNAAEWGGVALTPHHSALVKESHAGGVVTAHEIAHSMGWVPPDNPLWAPHNHLDYMLSPGYWVNKRCEMGFFLWSRENSCDPNQTPFDFMHFTNDPGVDVNRWISKPTFEYLLNFLKVRPAPEVPIVGTSGIIFPNGTGTWDPWYRFEGVPDIPLNNTGQYRILYLNNNGSKIAETGFDSFAHLSEGQEPNVSFLSLKIPDVQGVNKIVIQNGTQILVERIISPSPPKVKIISPNGGEAFKTNDTIKVNWNASDPDVGDKLWSRVSFSQDNGTTWLPITTETTDKEIDLTIPPYIYTNSALIRVITTDGINSAVDISMPFSIIPASNSTLSTN
jgi:hypothetical protein